MNPSVRVRFPPSPTGYCHVGTARMAIINFLFAKKAGGTIIFRSEDTDKERSRQEFEEDIVEQLHWLGLSWDEFYRDSELLDAHTKALARLIETDKAYVSEEESKKEPGTMVRVVRFRNRGRAVTFSDVIRGDITFDTTELGDFVIARRVDEPLYNFSVVVNDGEQHITHVIRGEDHISNTPRQILIQEALGYERPTYAHYPLLLGADRSKLSKRTGEVAVRQYREAGYLPEALLNYIAVLGWTPPSGKEILSQGEMMQEFELDQLHKSGAIFDMEKLRWYNRHYLLTLAPELFAEQMAQRLKTAVTARNLVWDDSIAARLVPVVRERIAVWSDIDTLVSEGELDYFFGEPEPKPATIPGKGSDKDTAARHLQAIREYLSGADAEMYDDPERLKSIMWEYATKEGRGKVLWPMRYALSGAEKSPDPFTIASIIGKERSLARIEKARRLLQL